MIHLLLCGTHMKFHIAAREYVLNSNYILDSKMEKLRVVK